MAEPNIGRAAEAYKLIRRFDGINIGTLAVNLGISHSTMQSTLTTMAHHGLLVSEDKYGQLYAFEEGMNYVLG